MVVDPWCGWTMNPKRLLIQMLRHVTSPLVRIRPSENRRSRRGHPASRPPSPQLFDIDEEDC